VYGCGSAQTLQRRGSRLNHHLIIFSAWATIPPVNADSSSSFSTVIGFDFGLRRIGIAVAQTLIAKASPVDTFETKKGAIPKDKLDKIMGEWRPQAFVVGKPTHRQEGEGEHEMMPAIRTFVEELKCLYGLPVFLVDEHLSSFAAEEELSARGLRFKPGSKEHKKAIDSMAAVVILQTWLSEQGRMDPQ